MNQEKNQTEEKKEKKLNFHRAKEYQGQAIAAFLVIAAALLLYFALLRIDMFGKLVSSFLSALAPLIVGCIIAFLLTPIKKFLERMFTKLFQKVCRKKPVNQKLVRRISVLISILLALTLVGLLLLAIIPELIRSISTLIGNLPGYGDSLISSVKDLLDRYPEISNTVMPYISQFAKDLESSLTKYLSSFVSAAYDWVSNGLVAAFKLLYNLLIGLIISMYLLGDTEYYLGVCKKVVFAVLPNKTAGAIMKTMHKANTIYSGAILGKIVDSCIIGLLCFIGANILSIFFPTIGEYILLVSIVVGVTNVIPFFGPYIGGVPCTLLIMCIHPLHGLIFGLFLVLLQQFDCNYLDPHIVGGRVGLKPVFVLCACLIGAGMFGIKGMLVAVPTFALIYSLLKSYFEVRLESKQLPTDTKHYAGTMHSYFEGGVAKEAGPDKKTEPEKPAGE